MSACRRSARRAAARASNLPAWGHELQLVRGRCHWGSKRKPCLSRWGVIRVSIDLTSRASIDRMATVDCVDCGHVWYRTRVPALTADDVQATRLTLILPSESRRWYARGKWRKQGEDAIVIRDATLADLMAANDDWRKRNGTFEAARARAAAKRQAEDVAGHERAQRLLATLAAIDAARAAEEAAIDD